MQPCGCCCQTLLSFCSSYGGWGGPAGTARWKEYCESELQPIDLRFLLVDEANLRFPMAEIGKALKARRARPKTAGNLGA